jgi:predicted nucleic acid-binding protein
MILVDGGILIDFLRTKGAKLAALFRSLPVAICGATRAEILCGARSSADRQRLMVFLSPFRQVSIPGSLWDRLGDNLAALRASGVTVPFADAIVATVGIENDSEVWARDPHFSTMQKVLNQLRLFSEPP